MKVSEDVARLKALDREDSSFYKSLSPARLRWMCKTRGIESWGPRPLVHQQAATLACCAYRNYLLLLDKGLGKSKVLLDTFAFARREQGAPLKGLILCPNQTAVQGWMDQIKLHAPPTMTAVAVEAAPESKRQLASELAGGACQADLVVIDYPSLQTMLCDRRRQGQLSLNEDLAQSLGQRFQFAALDEIHLVKDYRTLRFEMLLRVLDHTTYCYGATATLFNQDPTEAWAQCYLVDGGETFGTTITAFRTLFCKDKYDPFARGNRVSVFDESKMDLFRTWLRGISIRYQVHECVDLPSLRFVRPELQMTDEQRMIYRQVVKEVREAKVADPDARVNAFQKLRRVMSGFIPLGKEYVPMAQSPKLLWLGEKLKAWNEPLVIFYEFTKTGEEIYQFLRGHSIAAGWLWAESKDKKEILRAWTREELSVLVIQNTVGAAALNLQRARRQIFYECPLSAIVRSQAEARCWRLGQEQVTYIYDLFFPRTVEERVFDRVREGMSLHAAVVEGTREEQAA